MVTTALRPESATSPALGFRPHRLTVDRYERMVEAGVFHAKDPVFLWKGELVEKMTKGHRHNHGTAFLISALVRLVPEGWHVRPEHPVILGDDSVPEPDLLVVRGGFRDYLARYPSAADVAFLIEVSDSSLSIDSGEVLAEYARAGIACYWIVNIPQRRVEVHRQPSGPTGAPCYAERHDYGPDDAVPVVLDGREIGRIIVRDILP